MPRQLHPRVLTGRRQGRAVRRRDPSLRLIRMSGLRLGGRPAVDLDVSETIGGRARRMRSDHMFGAHSEVALDAYAPPTLFHSVDHAVFSPLKRTLKLTAPS